MKKFFLLPFTTLLLLALFSLPGPAFAASTQQMVKMQQSHVHAHLAPTTAFQPAVTCSGNGCTGRDPVQTGCSATASTVLSGGIFNGSGQRIGTINLRFSSACGTNWAQVVSSIGSVPLAAIVTRASGVDGPKVSECEPVSCNGFVVSTSAFTNMVWAPDVPALAGGEIQQNGTNFFGCVTQDQSVLPCN
ncbi:MAG TPA: DUF2690 domain-containing protein [Ktedonosporobacter sp.]|nr:DUF2690 domain-containing protein [Ktedonosporobacter sp.]